MNYHQIKKDDLLNGDGIRVTVFLSGCDHHCHGCHNPQTWNPNSGQPFDEKAEAELFAELEKDYISGVTFSGGDPLNDANVEELYQLVKKIKKRFPNKTIWVYTGYTLEEICKNYIYSETDFDKYREIADRFYIVFRQINVLVDGKYEESKFDVNYPWAGSTNQRVIDVKETFRGDKIVKLFKKLSGSGKTPLTLYIDNLISDPDKNIVLYESK